jgi:hypothetical protein
MLGIAKTAHAWTGFIKRKNHHGHIVGASPLLDEKGITLRGLTMEIEIKMNLDAISCKWIFSIYQSSGQLKTRLYQLEAVPKTKKSHNA